MNVKFILYKKISVAAIALLCVFLAGRVEGQDKPENKSIINVSLHVVDENGDAIPNALVLVNNGITCATTDTDGNVSFNAKTKAYVTISFFGYEKKVFLINELGVNKKEVTLVKKKLFKTSDDIVPLPFISLKKRQITGGSSVLKSDQFIYPSIDFRNALTGLATGVIVNENHGAPGISPEERFGDYSMKEKINVSSRGQKMIYIIDDIPIDITESPIDPSEIESVTIINDIVGKSMYGPAGANGIIFIKTKRGRANERNLKINMESGVSMIDRFPEVVSGRDYAHLNNMARVNDGLDPLYNNNDISAYAKNDPYDLFHPNTNFREIMLNNTKTFRKINLSSSGGTEYVKYYSSLSYNGEGDIYEMGAKSSYDNLSARSNIDIKANNFIKIQFDFFGRVSFRKSPNYNYSSTGDIVEFESVIKDINTISPIAFPIYANDDPKLEAPWYAITSDFPKNPIGSLEENGYYQEVVRDGGLNVALDYDMSSILKGLKSRSYFGFHNLNLIRAGQVENYTGYTVTKVDTDTVLTRVHDAVQVSGESKMHDYYSQRFVFHQNLNYTKDFGKNSLKSSLTYYQSKVTRETYREPHRIVSGILTGLYSYDNKYNIQGVLNYSGGSSFAEEERYILSPTVGISWIISDEEFLNNVKFIDYVKLRAQAGVLGYESFLSPFYYRDNWTLLSGTKFGAYTTSQWFGSSTDNYVHRTNPNRIGNPELTWEKRREYDIGIDALLFRQKFNVEVNYYNHLCYDQVAKVQNIIPDIAGISNWLPRFNYEQTRYFGLETSIQYADYSGNFKYSIGGNAIIQDSKYEKYDEPNYRWDYQSRIGKPVDAIWGHTYLGKFKSDQEAMSANQIYDDVLHKSDLKYEDKNGDGVIDENDMSMIGRSSPKLYYSLNAKINYKNLELSILGTGYALNDILLNNNYYWNGWGDNNYSKFVLDNLGNAYPNIRYYKVNNNFVNSDFWLIKGGFFKIQNAELAWNVPTEIFKLSGAVGIRLFVRGANLFTFSNVKDIDPESKNSGVSTYPLFRTVTGGFSLTF